MDLHNFAQATGNGGSYPFQLFDFRTVSTVEPYTRPAGAISLAVDGAQPFW